MPATPLPLTADQHNTTDLCQLAEALQLFVALSPEDQESALETARQMVEENRLASLIEPSRYVGEMNEIGYKVFALTENGQPLRPHFREVREGADRCRFGEIWDQTDFPALCAMLVKQGHVLEVGPLDDETREALRRGVQTDFYIN